MTSCTKQEKKITVMNPFFEAYNTPFEVPPFDKIQNRHYLPAFEEGIKQHNAEIKIITDSESEFGIQIRSECELYVFESVMSCICSTTSQTNSI